MSPTTPAYEASGGESSAYIRGSALILTGKTISQAVEFGLQIFLIRYFSKSDFGAIAYALSIVFLLRAIALFEMPIAVSRYLPAYIHRRRDDLVLGGIALSVGLVTVLGALIAGGLAVFVGAFGLSPIEDDEAIRVLLVLAALIPVDALDILVTSLFATLVGARQIFIRQALVGPFLRLTLAVAVVVSAADVVEFAMGYVLTSAATLLVYGTMFVRTLRRDPTLARREEGMRRVYPSRDFLTFASPLLASTLVWLLLDSSDAVLIGFFHDIEEVAKFRAVVPLALATQGVMLAFTVLYAPTLARHVARSEEGAVTRLYWRSALWVTLISFPIFLLTFSFAGTTTRLILGPEYQDAGPVLAILALGYFVHLALGFNGLTLRVLGKVRYSVAIDLGAAVFNVGVNLVLIPRWGALGAAIGTSATLVLHNFLKQIGLWIYARIPPLAAGYRLPYATVVAVAILLAAFAAVTSPSAWVAVAAAGTFGLAVLWANADRLEIATTFPKVARLVPVRKAAPTP